MQPTPSSAAVSESSALQSDPLTEAACELVGRGAFSALWLDADLRILSTVGSVPEGAAPGVHAGDVLIALVGLDEELASLRTAASLKPLRIPNTAVTLRDGTQSQLRCTNSSF